MNSSQSETPGRSIAREVAQLFEARGMEWYGGEAVSQLEHALQAATFAEREGVEPSLVVAALLHDVGHLLHDLPEHAATEGIDDRHETLGTVWLKQRFDARVAAPVAMHVEAKRYLCAVDDAYHEQLSPASQLSLQLQGGPLSEGEVRAFAARPHFAAAVQLRRWDDAAKVVGMATPPLEHFAACIDHACQKSSP